ncbi:hypothetical protein Leryth_026711 [Lithospermum erythrorhizon]|nr:hypothetical protein Leryth_026711 [Lithospermum erythrorhizon]
MAEEFFPKWRSLTGRSLKLQEVDPNSNNLVASPTFYSERSNVIGKTDPADRTQLRMTYVWRLGKSKASFFVFGGPYGGDEEEEGLLIG